MHTHTYAGVHTRARKQARARPHTCIHGYVHTPNPHVHMCTHARMYTHRRVHTRPHSSTRVHACTDTRATALQQHACPQGFSRLQTPHPRAGATTQSRVKGVPTGRGRREGLNPRHCCHPVTAVGPRGPVVPSQGEPAPGRQQALCPGGRQGLWGEQGEPACDEVTVTRGEHRVLSGPPAEAGPRVRSAPSALGSDKPDRERGPSRRGRTPGSPGASGLDRRCSCADAPGEGRRAQTLAWRSGWRRL